MASLCGCAGYPSGPVHEDETGKETAVLAAKWAPFDLGAPIYTYANVRIHEINGRSVTMVVPKDVRVSAGVTQIALRAWCGPGPSIMNLCVTVNAVAGKTYNVRVGGWRREWAVSITEGIAESGKVTPIRVVYQNAGSDVSPCTGQTP